MTVLKNCKTHTRPRERRDLKRWTARLIRRQAKKDPENAPTRVRDVTRGWSD